MQSIRPISDLRNKFADVSREVHASDEPVIFTKNGRPDMIVMSAEAFEALEFDSSVYYKLKEAEQEASSAEVRYSPQDVLETLHALLDDEHQAEPSPSRAHV